MSNFVTNIKEVTPRKDKRKQLISKASEKLTNCDTPEEFIGWLTATIKESNNLYMYDIIQSALELGPEFFEKFKPEDWNDK